MCSRFYCDILYYIISSAEDILTAAENEYAFPLPLFYAIVTIGASLYSLRNRIPCSSMDTYRKEVAPLLEETDGYGYFLEMAGKIIYD